jgi:hypothetical protein
MRYVYCPMCGERVIVPIVPVRKNGVLTCSRHHLFSVRIKPSEVTPPSESSGLTFDGESSYELPD